MIRGIVEWAVHFRLLVLVLAAGLVAFGMSEVRSTPVTAYPEFQPVIVEVQAEALGLSADEVAEFITVPLEADLLNTVPWVDVIRSESVRGLSSIELIFQPGTDLLTARQVVQERLAEALVALPGVSSPPQMRQPISSTNRVMTIGLSSDELSLIDLSVLARWNIRPRLLGVPGVANVSIWGQREQQLQVQVDPERLRQEDVPLIDVIHTTANALWASPLSFVEASNPGTGGFIDTPNQRLGVQHISPISTADELGQVPLEERPDLRLADIGVVRVDHQPLIGDALFKDGRTGLLLVVEKFPNTGTLEVTTDIERALDELRPGLAGVDVQTDLYRPAGYINEGISNLGIGALVAAGLVLAILVLFLFDWRTTLVAAVSVPLSLFAAVLALDFLGEGLNSIVLAGLVVGLAVIIDDAVSGAEALRRRLNQPSSAQGETSVASAVIDAVVETRAPILYVSLIAIFSVVPLLFLEGVAGAFFPPFVVSYAVAIAASLIVALLVTPALAMLLFPRLPAGRGEPPFSLAAKRAYSPWLVAAVRRPLVVYGVAGVVSLAGLGLLTQLEENSLLPTLQQRDILIQADGAPGTSHPEMTRLLKRAVEDLQAVPGVMNVGGHVGRAISSDQVVDINSAEIWVRLEDSADTEKAVNSIQVVMDRYPGLSSEVGNLPQERIGRLTSGSDKDITVRVYGEELDVLADQAEQVLSLVNGVDGVADGRIEYPQVQPTVHVRVDLEKAEPYGLKPGDVRRTAATLLSGIQVGSLFEEQKVFEVVVWSMPNTRSRVSSVENLLIGSSTGEYVRLGDVAEVTIEPDPISVSREAVSRYIDVTANADGRGISSIEGEIEEGLRSVDFPLEYHAELLRDKTLEGRVSESNVAPFVFASVIGVYLLLQAAFASWRLATLAFLTLPFGLVGGVVALVLFDGGELSLGAYAGFFAVLALSVRNGIALFADYLRRQRQGRELNEDLVVEGAQRRVVPALVTALAVVLAMIPAAVAGQIAGYEVINPLAIVVIGSVITATLVSLFVLPVLYLQLGPKVISTENTGVQIDG